MDSFVNIDGHQKKSQIMENIRKKIIQARDKKRGFATTTLLGRKGVIDQRKQGQSVQEWIDRNLLTRLTPEELNAFKVKLLQQTIREMASAPPSPVEASSGSVDGGGNLSAVVSPRQRVTSRSNSRSASSGSVDGGGNLSAVVSPMQQASQKQAISSPRDFNTNPSILTGQAPPQRRQQLPQLPQQQDDITKSNKYYDTWIELLKMDDITYKKHSHSIRSVLEAIHQLLGKKQSIQQDIKTYANHIQREKKKLKKDDNPTAANEAIQMILEFIGDKLIILKNAGTLFDVIRVPLTESLLNFLLTHEILVQGSTRRSLEYDLYEIIFKYFPIKYSDSLKRYIIRKLDQKQSLKEGQAKNLMKKTVDDLIDLLVFGKTYTYKIKHKKRPTLEQLRKYIRKGQLLEEPLEDGKVTPLISASFFGNIDIVRELVQNGANIDAQNTYGMSALMWAADKGYKDILEYLIHRGAKIDAQNTYGNTALMLAASEGHEKIVDILIENRANLDVQNQSGETALMRAIINGHEDIVKRLIAVGANIDLGKLDNITPLIVAVIEKNTNIVAALIEAGADVNAHTIKMKTSALRQAVENGSAQIVRLLIDAGANPLETNIYGNPPAFYATNKQIKSLLKKNQTENPIPKIEQLLKILQRSHKTYTPIDVARLITFLDATLLNQDQQTLNMMGRVLEFLDHNTESYGSLIRPIGQVFLDILVKKQKFTAQQLKSKIIQMVIQK